MKNRKKILLTGASGTIGFEVLKQLYQKKELYDITVFDIKSSQSVKKFDYFKNDITIVYGNIFDENDLNSIDASQDFVIHLAATIPPLADENPKLSHLVNTTGTEKLIRALLYIALQFQFMATGLKILI